MGSGTFCTDDKKTIFFGGVYGRKQVDKRRAQSRKKIQEGNEETREGLKGNSGRPDIA